MAQIKVTNAQYPLIFNVELGPDDIGNEVVVDVQPGFILLRAVVAVRTAFNGTTPTISVVDNKDTPTEIIDDATSLATVAATAATVLYGEYPSGGKLRILPVVASGSVTAGLADVLIEGIVKGRQNERIGTNAAT